MATVKCQHSGIEFEAKSTRTKQHPRIAQLKADANKRGNYRQVNEALDAVKKSGEYETIDEYMNLVNDYLAGKKQQAQARAQKRAEWEAEQKAKTAEENVLIKANGYVYKSVTEIINDDGQGEYDLVERKVLFSPDGRHTDRWEALDEIKRGADVVQAEKAANKAAVEAKERAETEEKAAKSTAHDKALAKLDAEIEKIKSENTQIERPEISIEWKTIKSLPYNSEGAYRRHDQIERGEVNGIAVYCVIVGTGYDDDGYYSYFCADPEAANLKVAETNDEDDPYGLNDSAAKFLF